MVSVGAPGMANSTTSLWFSLSAYATVEIKAIREREHVSQTVFANYLNVTSSLVGKWERGEKRPSGASLKLLSLVEKNGLATVA